MLLHLFAITLAAATIPEPAEYARAASYPKEVADRIIEGIYKEREKTAEWMSTSPTSHFTTVSRRDFEGKKTLTVGRTKDNDLVIDDPVVEEHHLRVTVKGDSFQVEAVDPLARFVISTDQIRQATVPPGMIRISRFYLRLSHQNYPAIIVFDRKMNGLERFRGLKHYRVDLNYCFALPLTENPAPDTVVILSTRGNQRRALRIGWFHFMVGDTKCRLEAVRLLEPGIDEKDVAVFFQDATNGKDTYPLGRYVDALPLPGGTGKYLLDFNRAYNPACAYSPHYNCPIPPKENVLKVAIPVGEQDSHYADHETEVKVGAK